MVPWRTPSYWLWLLGAWLVVSLVFLLVIVPEVTLARLIVWQIASVFVAHKLALLCVEDAPQRRSQDTRRGFPIHPLDPAERAAERDRK